MSGKKVRLPLPLEHGEQVALIDWANANLRQYPELRWLFAIPNGGKLPFHRNRKGQVTSRQRIKLVREGLRAGVADLMLPVPRGEFHGLFLELKRKPNKVSDEQEEFLAFVKAQGYFTAVGWSFEEGRDFILQYLRMQKG